MECSTNASAHGVRYNLMKVEILNLSVFLNTAGNKLLQLQYAPTSLFQARTPDVTKLFGSSPEHPSKRPERERQKYHRNGFWPGDVCSSSRAIDNSTLFHRRQTSAPFVAHDLRVNGKYVDSWKNDDYHGLIGKVRSVRVTFCRRERENSTC
jgi:hypothetical protein